MKNLLIYGPAQWVEIGGKRYGVHTDFRNWLKIEILINEENPKNFAEILKLCYKDTLPPNLSLAMEGVMKFYSGGEKTVGSKRPVYDFNNDWMYIFCDFYSKYRINLLNDSLHWEVFKALFAGLDETSLSGKIMNIRSMDLGKISDKNERRKYMRLKHAFRLNKEDTEDIFGGEAFEQRGKTT